MTQPSPFAAAALSSLARLPAPDEFALILARAVSAAATVLFALSPDTARHEQKSDGTPVSEADHAADAAAKRQLAVLAPGIPVVSEETVQNGDPGPVFVLLDPLDGTREFLAGGRHFCVCAALICNGVAVAGAIAAPMLGRLWSAGQHAFVETLHRGRQVPVPRALIQVRDEQACGPIALVSRFHCDGETERRIAQMDASVRTEMSSAIKFGMIAEGLADLTIRTGPTMEWDVAAGDVILRAAGGTMLSLTGQPMVYGRWQEGYRNPPFAAAASQSLLDRALQA
jgi:3'(2'), 5'-bisphosphate nucleotidase